MFKKNIKVRPGHTQSAKDRQALLQSLSQSYSVPIAEAFLARFPNLVKSHVEASNIVLYLWGKDPVLFTDGVSKEVYPSRTCLSDNLE